MNRPRSPSNRRTGHKGRKLPGNCRQVQFRLLLSGRGARSASSSFSSAVASVSVSGSMPVSAPSLPPSDAMVETLSVSVWPTVVEASSLGGVPTVDSSGFGSGSQQWFPRLGCRLRFRRSLRHVSVRIGIKSVFREVFHLRIQEDAALPSGDK